MIASMHRAHCPQFCCLVVRTWLELSEGGKSCVMINGKGFSGILEFEWDDQIISLLCNHMQFRVVNEMKNT